MPTKVRCHKHVRTKKALEQNLKPVVVVNKIDKPSARPEAVVDEVLIYLLNLKQMMNNLISQLFMHQL